MSGNEYGHSNPSNCYSVTSLCVERFIWLQNKFCWYIHYTRVSATDYICAGSWISHYSGFMEKSLGYSEREWKMSESPRNAQTSPKQQTHTHIQFSQQINNKCSVHFVCVCHFPSSWLSSVLIQKWQKQQNKNSNLHHHWYSPKLLNV